MTISDFASPDGYRPPTTLQAVSSFQADYTIWSHPFLFLKLSISTFSSWGTHHLNTTCLPLKIYCTDVGASFLRTTGKRGAQKEEYSHSFHWEVVCSKQQVDSKGSERPLYLCRARKTNTWKMEPRVASVKTSSRRQSSQCL